MEKHILLIGFMGVGKSTIAETLGKQLSLPVADTDQMIVAQEGMSIPEIFDQKGEPYFRECETELLKKLRTMAPMIISCGGGMAMREENAALMKAAGHVVLLTAKPETILERVMDDDNRPLLRGHKNVDDINALMEKRRPRYEAAASFEVATDHQNVEAICQAIIEKIAQ